MWVLCLRNRKYLWISNANRSNRASDLYYEHDYPRIARQEEVLLAINCVNNKMRETLQLKI